MTTTKTIPTMSAVRQGATSEMKIAVAHMLETRSSVRIRLRQMAEEAGLRNLDFQTMTVAEFAAAVEEGTRR